MVGSTLTPTGSSLGPNHRGPQDPAVICPASGPGTDPAPPRCDDTEYGKGTGGQLRYRLNLPADRAVTVWFAVAGSDRGFDQARATYRNVVNRGESLLQRKIDARYLVNRRSVVSLPGDRLLQRSVTLEQAEPGRLRAGGTPACGCASVNAGTRYPAPSRDGLPVPGGSARAGPTTRGCSAPTVSTRRSRRSPSGQFEPTSRRTCARCVP